MQNLNKYPGETPGVVHFIRGEEIDYQGVTRIKQMLSRLDQPVHFLQNKTSLLAALGDPSALEAAKANGCVTVSLPAYPIERLGDQEFRIHYGARCAYMAGAMAHGISGEDLVIALGNAGYLGSYGAGGISPVRIEKAIQTVQSALPEGPYAFNLIFNPSEPSLERKVAELYVQHGVTTVEASAFLDITLPLVYYRVSGLSQNPEGYIRANNKVIAKLSRKEVAGRFMQPAPQDILDTLLQDGKISREQARWAQEVPLADDITVEADSGGHTDNRPLLCLLPTMFALRNEIQRRYGYRQHIRIGAAGGISTPESALAAFAVGASYIVTGSINQSCVEARASEHTRRLLAQADMADVIMAPAADMFEMGVRVQVLKRGTMFAMRAQKLYDLYKSYNSIEEMPADERLKIEKTIFKTSLDEVWGQTEQFFRQRDPSQIERARQDSHHKMALIFRWYLGLSSHWSNHGEKGREMDYQIWCGPAMGTFNDWARGTYLEQPEHRSVVDLADQIMQGAAYLSRLQLLKIHGISLPPDLFAYPPQDPFKTVA